MADVEVMVWRYGNLATLMLSSLGLSSQLRSEIRVKHTHIHTPRNAMTLWGKVQAQCWQQISKFKTYFGDSDLQEISPVPDSTMR